MNSNRRDSEGEEKPVSPAAGIESGATLSQREVLQCSGKMAAFAKGGVSFGDEHDGQKR